MKVPKIPDAFQKFFYNYPTMIFCGIATEYVCISSFDIYMENKNNKRKIKMEPDISFMINDKYSYSFNYVVVMYSSILTGVLIGAYYPVVIPSFICYKLIFPKKKK